MNYIQKRVADRKLTCARCQAVGRAFQNLEDCRDVVALVSRPEADDFDRSNLTDWEESLRNLEAMLAKEVRPENWVIKRGETCMFFELSGAHYLHLACVEKYLEDVRRAMAFP